MLQTIAELIMGDRREYTLGMCSSKEQDGAPFPDTRGRWSQQLLHPYCSNPSDMQDNTSKGRAWLAFYPRDESMAKMEGGQRKDIG